MFSEENRKSIGKVDSHYVLEKIYQLLLFVIFSVLNFCLNIKYSDEYSLILDKIIDVSSIFFGVFIGSIYLFSRIQNKDVYSQFLKLCRELLYFNIIVIAYSFIIMYINSSEIIIEVCEYNLDIALVIFSIYLGLLAVLIYQFIRYVRIIMLLIDKKNPE